MTSEHVLETYMKDLDRELMGLSSRERQEITAEIRTHLLEKCRELGGTATGMLNAIEEFGRPETIAQEYTGRAVKAEPGSPPAWLAVVLTIIIWPAGIILAWLSKQWRLGNKLIATLIPLGLGVLLLAAVLIFYLLQSAATSIAWGSTAMVILNISVLCSPLISGVYLAATKIR